MGEGSTFVNNGTIKIVESCEIDTWFAMGGLFHRVVSRLQLFKFAVKPLLVLHFVTTSYLLISYSL